MLVPHQPRAAECLRPDHADDLPVTLPVPAAGRLAYLDGLRALAALAVVAVHAFDIYAGHSVLGLRSSGGQDRSFIRALAIIYDAGVALLGGIAVQVFIVISGFSLMLPVARSADGRLRGGIGTFFSRRIRRILPPYYAALALSLLVVAIVPGMNRPAGVYWDYALPALEPRAIIAHLLLIHNADGYGASFSKINPPMWSIAVESQIYLAFPLLVWLWRTRGWVTMLFIALTYGALSTALRLTILPFSTAWFMGLFAFGMVGAYLGVSSQPTAVKLRRSMPWGRLTLTLAIGLAVYTIAAHLGPPALVDVMGAKWAKDYLLASVVTCLLIYCACQEEISRVASTPGGVPALRGLPRLAREIRSLTVAGILQVQPLVAIGRFSYSLYLVHLPILALVALVCRDLAVSPAAAYLAVLGVGIPLAIGGAYLFFLAFERPFLTSTPLRTSRLAGPVALSGQSGG